MDVHVTNHTPSKLGGAIIIIIASLVFISAVAKTYRHALMEKVKSASQNISPIKHIMVRFIYLYIVYTRPLATCTDEYSNNIQHDIIINNNIQILFVGSGYG